MDCFIRECNRIDLPEIAKIEKEIFEFYYTREELEEFLTNRSYAIYVAEQKEKIVGYLISKRVKNRNDKIQIQCIGVDKKFQNQKIGKQLLNNLKKSLQKFDSYSIFIIIRETNLEAQIKFRSLGFKAIKILKNFYDLVPYESGYLMVHRVKNKILN